MKNPVPGAAERAALRQRVVRALGLRPIEHTARPGTRAVAITDTTIDQLQPERLAMTEDGPYESIPGLGRFEVGDPVRILDAHESVKDVPAWYRALSEANIAVGLGRDFSPTFSPHVLYERRWIVPGFDISKAYYERLKSAQREALRDDGFFVVSGTVETGFSEEDPNGMRRPYAYTVGMEACHALPDLLIVGVPDAIARPLLDAVARALSGQSGPAETQTAYRDAPPPMGVSLRVVPTGFDDHLPCRVVPPLGWDTRHLCAETAQAMALRHLGPQSAVFQVVVPDANDRYPGDEGCEVEAVQSNTPIA